MGIRGGAGRLRHRVRIQRLTKTTDAAGYEAPAYADMAERWAAIDPLKQIERIESQKVKGFTSHQIAMRYFSEIKSADRIVFKSRKFHIENVIDLGERNLETVIVAVEVSE